ANWPMRSACSAWWSASTRSATRTATGGCAAIPAPPTGCARPAGPPSLGWSRCNGWAPVRSCSTAWTATACAAATTSRSCVRCGTPAPCRWLRPGARGIRVTSPKCSPRPTWTERLRAACSIPGRSPSRRSRRTCGNRVSRCAVQPEDIEALAWERSTDPRAGGLLPAVVQDAGNQRVLMLGWMSRDALRLTLESGWVTFHSRSRGRLWTKGETSGHRLALVSAETDCDGDTLLVQARPQGPTCHLGRGSCFARAPAAALAQLDAVIAQRERERSEEH